MGMNNKVSKYEGISVSLCDRKRHSRRPRSACLRVPLSNYLICIIPYYATQI